jgi:hypothetical protein
MLTKDANMDFEKNVQSQNWETVLHIIAIDAGIDLWDIHDIKTKKTDNKDILRINEVSTIESYGLISNTSKYVFYIYYNKTKPDTYYLVWIADWCAPTPCSNIVSIEFLN